MITINILEKTDVLKKGDWCRPLNLCTMSGGMGDGYSFKSMYSGAPENNTYMIYEYARGDVPADHIHPDAEALDYDANLKDGVYNH